MPEVGQPDVATRPAKLLRRLELRPGEGRAVGLAFVYFFALLCGMYLVRPLREEMGIRGGVDRLDRAFLGTFLAMLVAVPLAGWLFARVPRGRAIPIVYLFFASHLVLFALGFSRGVTPWLAQTFFVWVSVYNLFVTSVFWSFMADLFTSEQGKRLFGLVAAGGSAGALVGPLVTTTMVRPVGIPGVVLLSAALLSCAAACAAALARRAAAGGTRVRREERALGGSPFAGFTAVVRSPYLAAMCVQILCFSVTSTFIYFGQARIVAATLHDPARRTQLFATVDLAVNLLSLGLQSFATGRILSGAGLALGLALHPALSLAGVIAIASLPSLAVLTTVQAVRRAVHYAVERPAREVLFTVVPREDRYKAKGFIDTVVYRGGDAAGAVVQGELLGASIGVSAAQLLAMPVAAAWIAVALWLARRQHDAEAG
jgi:AAA family ATP:ADP antiporter